MVRAKLHADGFHTVKWYICLDVTDVTAKKAIDLAEDKLDVLVKNAGMFSRLSTFSIPTSKLIKIISCWQTEGQPECNFCLSCDRPRRNFFGLVQTTIRVAFLPLLRKSTNVVNVATMSSTIQARPNASLHFTAYNTSKAAANSYTIALAQSWEQKVSKWTHLRLDLPVPSWTASGKVANRRRLEQRLLLPWALLEKDGPTCMFEIC